MPSARSADGQMVLGQLLPHLSDALMGMPEPHALFRCAEVLESIFQRIKLPFCPMTKPTEGALSAKDGTSSERVQTDAESAGSEALASSKAVSQSDHEDAWSDFWAGARSTLPIMIGIFYGIRDFHYVGPANFLWIQSISNPDPMYILPVLSALTTFVQSKQTMPDTSSAQNKMMLYFMPLFIGYISFSFPAGLVLYWVVMNLMQIGQQALMNKATVK